MTSQNQLSSFVANVLTCPITLEPFVDPVIADDGYTYERTAIVEWIKNHNETSPMTRQVIKLKDLKSNRIVKQLADQYRSTLTPNVGKEIVIFSGNGTLLNKSQQILFNSLFQKPKKWALLYKATRDGFSSVDFHRLCNNHGATLTLIQTRNRLSMKKSSSIFGGYTTVPWSSRYGYHQDPQAFLFHLNANRLTRFNLRSTDEIAVSHHLDSGPIFGIDDIHICHRANEHVFSHSTFPKSYADESANGKGRKTFSRTKRFLVGEIEVYMVIA